MEAARASGLLAVRRSNGMRLTHAQSERAPLPTCCTPWRRDVSAARRARVARTIPGGMECLSHVRIVQHRARPGSGRRPSSGRHRSVTPRQHGRAGAAPHDVCALVGVLEELGVEHAFGILGGAIAPFCSEIADSSIRLTTFCHEGGAGFAAIELSLATGRPVVVFGTTGPGITNMVTAMNAARWEGARVIFVSGYTPPARRGRWPLQETSGSTACVGELFTAGPVFHYASVVEDGSELDVVTSRLAVGMSRPTGSWRIWVAPRRPDLTVAEWPQVRFSSLRPPACSDEAVRACAELLSREPFVIGRVSGRAMQAGAPRTCRAHRRARHVHAARKRGRAGGPSAVPRRHGAGWTRHRGAALQRRAAFACSRPRVSARRVLLVLVGRARTDQGIRSCRSRPGRVRRRVSFRADARCHRGGRSVPRGATCCLAVGCPVP